MNIAAIARGIIRQVGLSNVGVKFSGKGVE